MSLDAKAIICLNGNIPKTMPLELPIIAADGAYDQLIKNHIQPDYVVGDFDSIKSPINTGKTQFIHNNDQNYYDFEKCIFQAEKLALLPAIVVGGSGGEFDHSLNNINLLVKYSSSHPMIWFDNDSWAIVLQQDLNFNTKIGSIISLIPYPKATVSSKGLLWELNADILAIDGKSSARNQATSDFVSIKIITGTIILHSKNLFFYN